MQAILGLAIWTMVMVPTLWGTFTLLDVGKGGAERLAASFLILIVFLVQMLMMMLMVSTQIEKMREEVSKPKNQSFGDAMDRFLNETLPEASRDHPSRGGNVTWHPKYDGPE